LIKLVDTNSPRPPDKRFVAETDDSLKPFFWAVDPDKIIVLSGVGTVPNARFPPN
jgi:hypothetical protein